MDDRTLLELASRAAGYEVARWTDDGTALLLVGEQEPWNALHENPHSDCMGDALRLAVKSRIDIPWQPITDDTSEDEERALIRRAIVRAAAAVAQTTKEQT